MSNHTLIIAEAGVNHNGDINRALELVHAAAESGADIVKFQTFKAELLVTPLATTAEYQNKNLNLGPDSSQYEMLKKLEISFENHHILIELCRKLKIGFLSTAFDFSSLDFLISLKLGLWKIPSGEITNLPYLEKIARLNQKTLVSTGMCDLNEVQEAFTVLTQNGLDRDNIVVLHCNTDYPTDMKDVHLNAMVAMGQTFGTSYGYSDHTLGLEVPVAAVALGASVIEKHFTLSRKLEGPDHAASLEPGELNQMVRSIRYIELALGRSEKLATESEKKNRQVARKSIIALTDIKKGEKLSEANLTTRRPGHGTSPMRWYDVIGQVASQDYAAGDLL